MRRLVRATSPSTQDIILAAPLWHDWAKTIALQWTAAGAEFPALNFGGNGKTDKYGEAGNSKTGGHHILRVAEAMARGLPPAFVVAQASAHAAPAEGAGVLVVNWLRSAPMIARKDPIAAGSSRACRTGPTCWSSMYCTICRMPTIRSLERR